jgi:hypothetical protein
VQDDVDAAASNLPDGNVESADQLDIELSKILPLPGSSLTILVTLLSTRVRSGRIECGTLSGNNE